MKGKDKTLDLDLDLHKKLSSKPVIKGHRASLKLMIPQKDNTWQDIDLATCLTSDFETWLHFVHPGFQFSPGHCSKYVIRIEAFKEAMRFHKYLLTVSDNNTIN